MSKSAGVANSQISEFYALNPLVVEHVVRVAIYPS